MALYIYIYIYIYTKVLQIYCCCFLMLITSESVYTAMSALPDCECQDVDNLTTTGLIHSLLDRK